MEQNFTDEDLEQLLKECISELESLGYELVPISSIKFTNRNSRCRYGVCKTDNNKCYFDPFTFRLEGTPTVYIRITGNLRYLPLEMRSNLKTLVMHETIHAIKAPESDDRLPTDFATPHGNRYNHIRDDVEKNLGYTHIDDNTACGLRDFLTWQYENTAANVHK